MCDFEFELHDYSMNYVERTVVSTKSCYSRVLTCFLPTKFLVVVHVDHASECRFCHMVRYRVGRTAGVCKKMDLDKTKTKMIFTLTDLKKKKNCCTKEIQLIKLLL